ncbi:MAG: DUF421 domain-containing protein [Chlamydiales bacterium]
MDWLSYILNTVFGVDGDPIEIWQMCLRALVAYISLHLAIRLGHKKLLSEITALDYLMMILIGATISRGINGDAPFIPTILTSLFLIFLHWILSALTFHYPILDWILKNNKRYLIQNGKFLEKEMNDSHISKEDLLSEMRVRLNQDNIKKIKEAILEKNGKISFQISND